jgi:predicted MFS family arabinose efflux permease
MPYRTSLDWLNFLLADVRGGLGPYVNVFLLTEAGWDQATIGAVLTVSGLLGIALHAPVGALIDATRAKRGLLIVGTWALAACALAIATTPTLPVVIAADMAMAVLGAVFAPTVAAMTLGLVGRDALPVHLGRNAAFDRAGNLFIAALAGLVGTLVAQKAVFFLVPFFAVLATAAILAIPARAIDHERARGFEHGDAHRDERPAGWRAVVARKPFLVLAGAALLFHFANGPIMNLVAQKLALGAPGREAAVTAGAIIVAQLATIPAALLVTRANRIGRKPLMLLAFAALPLRAALFAITDEPALIMGLQVLDAVGGGLFEALLPLVLADVVRGTGRYNVSRGVLGTIQGIGGASSHAFGGYLAAEAGYGAAFLSLAGVGVVAFVLVLLAMPETRPAEEAGKVRG